MRTTQQRCVFCNEELSEDVIKNALLAVWWRVLGPYDDDIYEEEGAAPMPSYLPREGEHWNLQWTPELGWHHLLCWCAHGSGRTPEQQGAASALWLHQSLWQQGMISTARYETIRMQFLPFLHSDDVQQYR